MPSWELPDPPQWLLQKAAAQRFTPNLADWRYHGITAGIPESVTCTHRGMYEAGTVSLEKVSGPSDDIYGIGKCEICGMIHWISSRR